MRLFVLASLVLFGSWTGLAHAGIAGQTHEHETLINSSFGSTAQLTVNGGQRVEINVGHLYAFHDVVQIGGIVGAGYRGTEYVNLMALVNLNFALGTDGARSLFVGGGAGWDDVTKGTRQFAWRADVGMRCKVFEHVHWRPTVGIQDRGAGVAFNAEFLALSMTY